MYRKKTWRLRAAFRVPIARVIKVYYLARYFRGMGVGTADHREVVEGFSALTQGAVRCYIISRQEQAPAIRSFSHNACTMKARP